MMKTEFDNYKRRRSANFTKNEVTALMFLIKKYKAQVDTKHMGTNSNRMKDRAWDKIAEEFNSLPGTLENPRTAGVLRNKYTNMKKLTKQKLAEKKSKNEENAQDSAARSEDADETSGVQFECDEDFDDMLELKEEVSLDDSQDGSHDHERESLCSDTAASAHSFISADASTFLPRKQVLPIKAKTAKTGITEQDLLELQKRCFLQEHALKLQHMQEKHDKTLRIQEEEAEERLRQMREEHKLQLEILQLRKQCFLK